jgi:hypothetical protein
MKYRAICVAALLPLLGTQAGHAAWCTGTVNYLSVDGAGSVSLYPTWRTGGFGYVKMCNLNQDWNGVTPLTCAGWYTSLKTAQHARAQVWWLYADSAVPASYGTGCTGMSLDPDSPVPMKIVPCATNQSTQACY